MNVLNILESLEEYIRYVNINKYENTLVYAASLQQYMTRLNNCSEFDQFDYKYHLAVDIHMMIAKLFPRASPRRGGGNARGGKVSAMKIRHERLRLEELLQLRHRITKKIARMSDEIIRHLYKTCPADLIPRKKLVW